MGLENCKIAFQVSANLNITCDFDLNLFYLL